MSDLSKNMLKISQTIRHMASYPIKDVNRNLLIIYFIAVVVVGWKQSWSLSRTKQQRSIFYDRGRSLIFSINHAMLLYNRNTMVGTWSILPEKILETFPDEPCVFCLLPKNYKHACFLRIVPILLGQLSILLDSIFFIVRHICYSSSETLIALSVLEAVRAKYHLATHLYDDFFKYHLGPKLGDFLVEERRRETMKSIRTNARLTAVLDSIEPWTIDHEIDRFIAHDSAGNWLLISWTDPNSSIIHSFLRGYPIFEVNCVKHHRCVNFMFCPSQCIFMFLFITFIVFIRTFFAELILNKFESLPRLLKSSHWRKYLIEHDSILWETSRLRT